MGLMDFMARNGQIPFNATFTLTELGKGKVEEYSGDNRGRILMALETLGAGNTDEIAKASHLSKGMVDRAIPALLRAGYIQTTNLNE